MKAKVVVEKVKSFCKKAWPKVVAFFQKVWKVVILGVKVAVGWFEKMMVKVTFRQANTKEPEDK